MPCTSIQNTVLAQVKATLETERAYDMGMSIKGSVRRSTNSICFSYPAPVVSGACMGTITVFADGSLSDDTSEAQFDGFDAWLADFEATCADAE